MVAAKKAPRSVTPLCHSYIPHNPPGIHLNFIRSFRGCPRASLAFWLILVRSYDGKDKILSWRWLQHFGLLHWRWLHALMTMVASFPAGNFWYPCNQFAADKCAFRLHNCFQVWYVSDLGGFTIQWQVLLGMLEIGIAIFQSSYRQLQINTWTAWQRNWNSSWVSNTVNVKEYMSFHSFILNHRPCIHKYEPSQPSPYQDSCLHKWVF